MPARELTPSFLEPARWLSLPPLTHRAGAGVAVRRLDRLRTSVRVGGVWGGGERGERDGKRERGGKERRAGRGGFFGLERESLNLRPSPVSPSHLLLTRPASP